MNYPSLINDARLTPELTRTRSGQQQKFYKPGDCWHNIPFALIEAPERHIFAKLIDDKWHWVNGCDECHGREYSSGSTYIKCKKHDICHSCKTPRYELKETPWGHTKGIECAFCHSKFHLKEKTEALAKMENIEYTYLHYINLNSMTCPYCNLEDDDPCDHYDALDEEVTCTRCDYKYKVTAEQSVTFSTVRIDQ